MGFKGTHPLLLQPRRLGIAVLAGAVGAVFFLFIFPKGSISTLMHHVLHLPGPGAGIALILGPVALVFALISSHLARGAAGGALLAALAFSVAYATVVAVLRLPTSEKGMFGSLWFVMALTACGVLVEGLLFLTRGLRLRWRFILAASGANTGLLVFYWVVIFPRTEGWVSWGAVPLLLAMSLAGGLVAGAAAWALSIRIPDLVGLVPRRESDVRTR
ncbi:MAG: hypothetical protein KAY32_09585 [Candidatus Eisenbacteria sp.]|nr:hypothetical protein [Candidatus Eisenbacteria bacterium]